MALRYCIDHVAVQVSEQDFQAAVRFYGDILGFSMLKETLYKGRRARWFQGPNIKIEVFTNKPGQVLNPWQDTCTGLMHLCLGVADFAEGVAHLKSQGVQFLKEPFEPEPGQWVAIIAGPVNEEIEIRQDLAL